MPILAKSKYFIDQETGSKEFMGNFSAFADLWKGGS
jgi:hypothetical protein